MIEGGRDLAPVPRGRAAGGAVRVSIRRHVHRHDRAIAALIWVPAPAVHRGLMPGLLRQTVRRQVQGNDDPAASPEGGH